VDFVEICNVCTRKVIIKAAKRIFNSDKICCSYYDFYFGVTFYGTHCIYSNKVLTTSQINEYRFTTFDILSNILSTEDKSNISIKFNTPQIKIRASLTL